MTGGSALLGALGLVGSGFGLLSFALALFGAPSDPFLIGANLVLGFLLLAFAAALNFDALRERLSSGEARRAGKYGTSAILTALFSIAILGLLGFMAERYPARFDWSEAKVHSLSDQTHKVLGGLESEVHAVAFFSPLDVAPVRELLDRYAYASDRFRVEYVDPSERPDLLERYQVAPEDLGEGLVRVALGEDSVELAELSEENITNAMVKLSRTGEKQVYFLEGHNERAIEGETASEKEAYSRAADALRNENYRVSTLLLAAKGEVPEDADVVVAAGATRPLLDPEHAALERYLRRGGALLVLVDPRANTSTGSEAGASTWGTTWWSTASWRCSGAPPRPSPAGTPPTTRSPRACARRRCSMSCAACGPAAGKGVPSPRSSSPETTPGPSATSSNSFPRERRSWGRRI
jgi:hypothetical protein